MKEFLNFKCWGTCDFLTEILAFLTANVKISNFAKQTEGLNGRTLYKNFRILRILRDEVPQSR